MKCYKYILLIFGLLCSVAVMAQNVTNVTFYQEGDKVIITYNLDRLANIEVLLSCDGGQTFSAPLQHVSGDVGKVVKAGNNRIVWDVLKEMEKLIGDNIIFRVKATTITIPQKEKQPRTAPVELTAPERFTKEPTEDKKTESTGAFDKVFVQGYLLGGTEFLSKKAGYTLDAGIGVRIKQYAYVGAEIGFHHLLKSVDYDFQANLFNTTYWYLPIGLNVKCYIPSIYKKSGKAIFPFVNASVGGYMGYGYYAVSYGENADKASLNTLNVVTDLDNQWNRMSSGFYCQLGAGFDFGKFSIGLGYTALGGKIRGSMGYCKLGYRFGKQ